MKKFISTALALLLLLSLCTPALAVAADDVSTLTVNAATASAISFTGTAGSNVLAVAVEIVDGGGSVALKSFAVESAAFSGSFTGLSLTAGVTYTLRAANYNGGSWTTTTFTLPVPPAPPASPEPSSNTYTIPVENGTGSVSASATVYGSTATVTITEEQLSEIAENFAGTVTVDLSGIPDVDSAVIPAEVITAVSERDAAEGLKIALPTGSVALDSAALAVVSSGSDVTVSIERVATTALTDAQRNALGDKIDSAVVVDVDVLINSAKVSDFGGGKVTISVPYTPKAGEDTSKLTVWFIKDDGSIENVGGYYDEASKSFVFDTTHLSRYALVLDTNPFADVSAGTYYYSAVLWAVENGITEGTSITTFSPNATCTRAQAVTFLWRAMGEPEPSATVNPFADVNADAYYFKAVMWAVENGVTNGTSNTTFSPNENCTRGQIVTLQYRTAGSPAAGTVNPFTDIAADAYYANAVLWAVKEKITNGTSATTFSPTDDCTRAQIVTFLYRQLGK